MNVAEIACAFVQHACTLQESLSTLSTFDTLTSDPTSVNHPRFPELTCAASFGSAFALEKLQRSNEL
jgi:hypothetical protein